MTVNGEFDVHNLELGCKVEAACCGLACCDFRIECRETLSAPGQCLRTVLVEETLTA